MSRTPAFRKIVFALFGFLSLYASTTAAIINDDGIDDNDKDNAIRRDLISWVRSKGGSFSDKLEIRRVDPTDPTSYMGVFVKEPIDAKEGLFVVPRDCYIDVFDTAAEMDHEDSETVESAYAGNLCQLATKLMTEMKLGKDSEYAPYIAYLKTQVAGQVPANWSKKGKDLLRKVVIPGSPMVDWIDWNFKGEKYDCIGKASNDNGDSDGISFEEHMVEMTVQRGYDTALIPIWDMVNHDNGNINTENDSMREEGGLRVRAARKLAKGEEVFASYDKCLDCMGVEEDWGTPEILKDFGFVESYPHRWVFPDRDIWFEVYDDDEIEVDFGEGHESVPSEEQIEFLTKEFARLEEVGEAFLTEQGSLPDKEWNTILRFHEVAYDDTYTVLEWYSKNPGDASSNATDKDNHSEL